MLKNRNKTNRDRHSAGFSLLELLVAVGVVAIGAAFVLTSSRPQISAIEFESKTEEIAFQLNTVRMRAIAKNTDIRMLFNAAQDAYTVQEFNKVTSSWLTVMGPIPLSKGILLAQNESVTFEPRGSTAATATVAFQTTGGLSRNLIVTRAGSVALADVQYASPQETEGG